MMGVCAVDLALGRGKLNLRHGRIIKAKMKTRTQSKKVNKAWLNDHVNDTYVKLAQKEGYRARAAYKLKEIDEAFGLSFRATWSLISDRHRGHGASTCGANSHPERRLAGARRPENSTAPSLRWIFFRWSQWKA